MSGDQTKDNIVRSIEELLKTRPLDSITITAITQAAKVSRQTFYFHFGNVFDVYKWAVSYNVYIPQDLKSTVPQSLVTFVSVLQSMQAHKEFTIGVFNSSYRAELYNYLLQLNDLLCEEFLAQFTKADDLSDHERDLLRRYFNHAAAGTALSWVSSGMNDDFNLFIDSQEHIMKTLFRPEISDEVISKWSINPTN